MLVRRPLIGHTGYYSTQVTDLQSLFLFFCILLFCVPWGWQYDKNTTEFGKISNFAKLNRLLSKSMKKFLTKSSCNLEEKDV